MVVSVFFHQFQVKFLPFLWRCISLTSFSDLYVMEINVLDHRALYSVIGYIGSKNFRLAYYLYIIGVGLDKQTVRQIAPSVQLWCI